MEFSIKPVGEACAASGKPFEPGERVRSVLVRTPEGLVERIDLLESEEAELPVEARVLCRWTHRIKKRDTSEAEARQAALQSAEDVFISLFEKNDREEEDPETLATRDRLKFFLALQLERKRVLKPVGGRRFRHTASGTVYPVPELEITPELVGEFSEEIALMGQPV